MAGDKIVSLLPMVVAAVDRRQLVVPCVQRTKCPFFGFALVLGEELMLFIDQKGNQCSLLSTPMRTNPMRTNLPSTDDEEEVKFLRPCFRETDGPDWLLCEIDLVRKAGTMRIIADYGEKARIFPDELAPVSFPEDGWEGISFTEWMRRFYSS